MVTLTWEIVAYVFTILFVVTGYDSYTSSRAVDKDTKNGLIRFTVGVFGTQILLIWMLIKDVM